MSRTKIVCTLGPASSTSEVIASLIENGADVFRLNFSHGVHADHAEKIRKIRAVAEQRQTPTAILQDLCGPKIRTGRIPEPGMVVEDGESVLLCASEDAEALMTEEGRQAPGRKVIPVDLAGFATLVDSGTRVFINDGLIRLAVESVNPPRVFCRIISGGVIGARKGVNLPGGATRIDAITAKDLEDLEMGLAHGVDMVALSFVRHADDIIRLRAHMERLGRVVPIIAKIEKAEAVANLEAIVTAADGVMVARGDLGIEVNIEETPLIQKRIIRMCNAMAKPVITATQMLESMVSNPIPTRAEATDVANAIFDGTDALMLSQETAIGKRPAEVVSMMRLISRRTEEDILHRNDYWKRDFARLGENGIASATEAIGRAAVHIADDLCARGIIACTMSGSTARLIARYRPGQALYAVTPDRDTWRRLNLSWGVTPLLLDMQDSDEALILEAFRTVQQSSADLAPEDRFVITAGLPMRTQGITNLIRVLTAEDYQRHRPTLLIDEPTDMMGQP